MKPASARVGLVLLIAAALCPVHCAAWRIIPQPQRIVARAGSVFRAAEARAIVIPPSPTKDDLFAADQLHRRILDVTDRSVPVVRFTGGTDLDRAIVLGRQDSAGRFDNPGARRLMRYWERLPARREGSIVGVGARSIVICGFDPAGSFYGLQSVIQLLEQTGGVIPSMQIYDYPDLVRRGVYLRIWGFYGKYDRRFAEDLISDVMARYKLNTLELDIHLGMRYDSHPDLNYPTEVASKREIATLAAFAERHHVEVVAAGVSSTHADQWITDTHPQLAFDDSPAELDLSKPETQAFVKDIIDEQIEVCHPRILHIGGDESTVPSDRMLPGWIWMRDYLKAKGIRAAMWGDMVERDDLGARLPKDVIIQDWDYTSSKLDYPSLREWKRLGMTSWVCPYGGYTHDGVPGPYNIMFSAVAARRYGSEGLVAFNKARLGERSRVVSDESNYALYPYYAEWSWHTPDATKSPLPFDGREVFLRQIPPDCPGDAKAERSGRAVNLSWRAPTTPSTAGIRVVYRSDRYPQSAHDGQVVRDARCKAGDGGAFTHTPRTAGTAYYSIYAYDLRRCYSEAARAVVR